MLRWSSGDQSRRLALILANVIEAPSSGRPMCTAARTGTGERPTAMPDAGLSKRDELTEVVEAFRDALLFLLGEGIYGSGHDETE
jgi:hypothetical protein